MTAPNEEEKNLRRLRKSENRDKQRLRSLYLYELLLRCTDSSNGLTMAEIVRRLDEEYGIIADPTAIYKDIAAISAYFAPVCNDSSPSSDSPAALPPKRRVRALFLFRLLAEQTDEEHRLTMNEMISKLAEEEYGGIKADDNTLYKDIAAIADNFALVANAKRKKTEPDNMKEKSISGYYIKERRFGLSDVKLLADAVAAARFITDEQSAELIAKLGTLVSVHQAREILHQSHSERTKAELPDTDAADPIKRLHKAIEGKTVSGKPMHYKISFDYYEYDVNKQLVKRGERRTVTPYTLEWVSDRYYLIGSHPEYGIAHYRIDRMGDIRITNRIADPIPEGFDAAEYIKTAFSMFGGREEEVTLRFDNSLATAVIDRFGEDVTLIPGSDGHFTVRVRIKTERPEPFFGWLFGFGTKPQITEPASLREKYHKMLVDVAGQL